MVWAELWLHSTKDQAVLLTDLLAVAVWWWQCSESACSGGVESTDIFQVAQTFPSSSTVVAFKSTDLFICFVEIFQFAQTFPGWLCVVIFRSTDIFQVAKTFPSCPTHLFPVPQTFFQQVPLVSFRLPIPCVIGVPVMWFPSYTDLFQQVFANTSQTPHFPVAPLCSKLRR